MNKDLPQSWLAAIGGEFDKPYFNELSTFVNSERARATVFPPESDVFNALRETPYDKVRVLILGQDPYHGDGQAHGLAFSVLPGIKPPPSLANMFKELKTDIPGFAVPKNGTLTPWARQGILLLNAVLTVRAHEANSHKGRGWETFTDGIISALSARPEPIIFVLWGGYARKKVPLIDTSRHTVIESAHPSPLSAHNGFFGSRPFSKINAQLAEWGEPEIDWTLS